jgi:hypothetical protein
MLTAFSAMYKRPGTPQQILKALLADARRSKGIPTAEDQFAKLLVRATNMQNVKRRFALLRRARLWLIARNRGIELADRRRRGKQGGRPSKVGIHRPGPTLAQAIVSAAAKAVAEVPGLAADSRRRLVAATAKRIEGFSYSYSKLAKSDQKQRRDYIRKVLTQDGWFSSPIATFGLDHKRQGAQRKPPIEKIKRKLP